MRKLVSAGIITFSLLPLPAYAAISVDSSLTAWTLTGELMVDGDSRLAAEVARLPCPEVHEAIEEYNAGSLRITPPPTDWTPSDFIEHYDLTGLELRTLTTASGIDGDSISKCSSLQDGWAPVLANYVGQVVEGDAVVRLVSGETPACVHGQVQMIGTAYVWDWVRGGWSWAYGRDWIEATELTTPGVVGRLTYVYECLTLYPQSEDFAEVASLVPDTQVLHNPAAKGLTGLDIWLWYDFTAPQSHQLGPLTTTVNRYGRDWTLQTSAWVDQVWWNPTCETGCSARDTLIAFNLDQWRQYDLVLDLDDTPTEPASIYDGGAEAADRAAQTFVYRTKDSYTFSAATIWRGTYLFNGVIYTYDPVIVANSHPYQVFEIRTQLTNG